MYPGRGRLAGPVHPEIYAFPPVGSVQSSGKFHPKRVRHQRHKYNLWGMLAGVWAIARHWHERDPVRKSTYREYKELQKWPKRIEDVNL